jgi:hypothetical protein
MLPLRIGEESTTIVHIVTTHSNNEVIDPFTLLNIMPTPIGLDNIGRNLYGIFPFDSENRLIVRDISNDLFFKMENRLADMSDYKDIVGVIRNLLRDKKAIDANANEFLLNDYINLVEFDITFEDFLKKIEKKD